MNPRLLQLFSVFTEGAGGVWGTESIKSAYDKTNILRNMFVLLFHKIKTDFILWLV